MWDVGLYVKSHLKTTSELHSISVKWKHDAPSPPASVGGMGGARQGHSTPGHPILCWRRAGAGDTWHLPTPALSPSLVSKQECLNAFYVVTQMMKGPKMGLTKTSCTSE